MNKKNQGKYVRDHVSSWTKDLKNATEKKFGVSNRLIVAAALEDEESLTQIADMGKTGEKLKRTLPLIRQHLASYIDGTTEFNQTLSEIYTQGGKQALTIQQLESSGLLENTRFNNTVEELTAKYLFAEKAEEIRHGDTMDSLELQAWIDAEKVKTDQQSKLEGIANRPFINQLNADIDYQNRRTAHLLQYGSDADLSLLPRKEYATSSMQKAWNFVRGIFS